MRSLFVWVLLALVPCSSVRIVCLDADGRDLRLRPSVAATAAPDAPGERCRHACTKHARPAPKPAKMTCLVTAAPGGCAFVVNAAAAVLPPAAPLAVVRVAEAIEPLPTPDAYRAPVRTPPGPPPKA